MINRQEKLNIQSDLSKFDNVGDMITHLNTQYDLKTAKLGPLTKGQFIKGIITAIEISKPKKI